MTAPQLAPTTGAPRALVVGAEPRFLGVLRVVLRGAGYVVESARAGPDALALVAEDRPDVLVLDLAPPYGESAEFCAGIRRLSAVPILILSPVGAQRETVRALEASADDYVPKPFRTQELLDRLRGVGPTAGDPQASLPLEVGDLVIDLVRRRVSRGAAVLMLDPEEFELVRVLAQHPGRLVTDRQLLRAAWGDQRGQETHRLRVTVARLRAKLEKDPWRSGYLIAEPGLGYRLCVPGNVARDRSAAVSEAAPSAPGSSQARLARP
jgi:two-component system, OmpR family, KDP operon response regulator KdpE